jgi:integrase/recombinase XerD
MDEWRVGGLPVHALLDLFLDYVMLERGLSDCTLEAYRLDLGRFLSALSTRGITSINAVTREHVTDFLVAERARGLSVASVARDLVVIKVFFAFLYREQLLPLNVTDVMDSPRLWQALPTVLSEREVGSLLEAPNLNSSYGLRDRAMLELFYACGLRVSELCALTLDAVQLDESYLRALGKGGKVRIVPIGEAALRYLSRYLEEVREGLLKGAASRYLFVTRRGGPFSRKSVWSMVKRYSDRAGITKNVSPHTLRHSFASHLLANGAPLRVIQELLGHADIATTQLYTHVDQNRLHQVHRQFHPRA